MTREFFLGWVMWGYFIAVSLAVTPFWMGQGPSPAARYAWWTGMLAIIGQLLCVWAAGAAPIVISAIWK